MGRISRRWVVGWLVLGPLTLAAALLAANAGSSVHGETLCPFGDGPPFAFQTYKGAQERELYLVAQQLAATNQLFPSSDSFALPEILVGSAQSRQPRPGATIPVSVMHGISWIESNLSQAARDVPWRSIGEVLLSPDCGYGLMQVTSYFDNDGAAPSRDEALVGAHYAYNIAVGAQILLEKWNADFFPVVGSGEPGFIESWYYALWAYNGWAFRNHPAGAETDPFRSLPFQCSGPRNGYAYQELVLGCVESPPEIEDVPLWQGMPVALPNLFALTGAGGPLNTEVYFAGWGNVFQSPVVGGSLDQPFVAMGMPLPQGAAPAPGTGPLGTAAQALRDAVLGDPLLDLETTTLVLAINEGEAEPGTITLANAGRGLLVYRVVSDVAWLEVDVQAGVAAGADLPFTPEQPRDATITLTPDSDAIPPGSPRATVTIEALLPSGSVLIRVVRVELGGAAAAEDFPAYEAGRPES